MRRRLVATLIALGALAGACRAFVDLDGLQGGAAAEPDASVDASSDDASSGDGATVPDAGAHDADADAGEAGPPCPAGMVVAGGAAPFCIDATEVTVGAYLAFLQTQPDGATQGPACSWKSTFTPDVFASNERPVAGVDWCDARAYCAYAGKRLCRDISGAPLIVDKSTTTVSEWFTACSAGGTRLYPYGDTFDPEACWSASADAGGAPPDQPQAVMSKPACVGSVPGLFDMSGNVFEWQDACDPTPDGGLPQDDPCAATGGDYGESPNNMRCEAREVHTRSAREKWLGFRCCKDL